jgi:hypothetical protein
LWSEECEVINWHKTKLVHAFRGSATSGLDGGGEVIKVEEFIGVARNVESEAGDLLETATWVVEISCFDGAILVHMFGIWWWLDVGIVGREVLPCLDFSGEWFVAAEWYVGYTRADAFIIEVELEDVGDSNTANTIDDDIEFVGEFGL